ncbi:MAG: OmpA family protein [Nitrospirota bacterium]|nr:OmpA family protein [Nitrospirota bacterium]
MYKMPKWTGVFLLLLLIGWQSVALGDELQIKALKPGAQLKVDGVVGDDKAMVRVSDAEGKPLLGLGEMDFSVTQWGRTARIISVEAVAESLDVPRHIVLVLDNSSSMDQRNAITPLLAGVDELLKIVRPIDQVHVVVFDKMQTVRVAGRELNVRIFESNNPVALKSLVAETYRDRITPTTVLYEGILAGIDIIRTLPAKSPKFLVVFSDGEDLNSAFKDDVVTEAAKGAAGFNAYAIDFMPVADTDKFLSEFADQNKGQIWKATSETNLVPIFQSVASRMQYSYMVSYLFQATGNLVVSPASVTIDELGVGDTLTRRLDTPGLVLRPTVDSAYGISSWNLTVANADGEVARVAGDGAPDAELNVPLPSSDPAGLIAGGDLKVTMEVQDGKGQKLALTAAPVKVNVFKTSGSLDVTTASVDIDELNVGNKRTLKLDPPDLMLRPVVDSSYGIERWSLTVTNADGEVAEMAGEGPPTAELRVPLSIDDVASLAAGGDLNVAMEALDGKGQKLALAAVPVKVNVYQTKGNLAVSPPSVTIEEIKTIDASPMLGHIYFDEGSSEISERYVRFASPDSTAEFNEQEFRDMLEKYYQVLNIVGKRLTDNSAATITLVGCNDNTGIEKGNRKLSTQRAEAVKNYLQTIWKIDPERIKTEARNLPEKPSTSRLDEGRTDNRRVEIISSDPAILVPILSVYLTTRIDTPSLSLNPEVVSPHGIARWTLNVSNADGTVAEMAGEGAPSPALNVPLSTRNLATLATSGNMASKMELWDRKGQAMVLSPPPVKVNFVQTSQRMAQKEDMLIQEKYALILFDFDSDMIDSRNQKIVNGIADRIRKLPQATVDIVGHTDNIGTEKYNIGLSERRAQTVYKMLTAAEGEIADERIRHRGVGPNEPLYDNTTSEARAFNRTVTITLEYRATE